MDFNSVANIHPMDGKNNLSRGILFIILSASSFAVMSFFVTLAGDLPFMQKAFFRNLIALAVSAIVLIREKPDKERLNLKGNWWWLFLRAAFGSIGLFCNFYAVDRIMLADASMLQKMSPFFAVILSIFILDEKPSWKQMVLVLGAFLASMLVVKPTFGGNDHFAYLIGLLGGLGAGAAYTCVRKLTSRGVYSPFIIFFFSLFSFLLTLPSMLFNAEDMSVKQLLLLLLAGCAAASGQFCVTAAYKAAPAKKISVYDYTQIIVSALLGLLFLHQIPDILSILGYILVITMGVLMFMVNKKDEMRAKQ